MAKRDYISAIFLIIILIVLSQSALSIGLSTIEIPKYIVALPNEKHVFSFEANGYTYDVLPYVVGDPDLTEYVILTEAKETYPYHKQFDAILQFPAEINATPGLRTVFVGAEEILAGTSQGVSAKTKVQYALKIQVLYDTRYIEASFSTQNVNMNSIADFAVGVKNFGKPNIKVLMVTVDVYSNGDLIKEITSDLYSLNSGKEINIPIQLNTSGMKPGDYNATATVYYDGDEKPLEGIFKIGDMKINILNYTKQIYSGRINKFDIEVESLYNGNIGELFAEMIIEAPLKNITAKTITESMLPLSRKTITGYIDAEGIEPGEYPLRIEAYYEKDKLVEKGQINVVKPGIIMITGNLWFIAGVLILVLIIILTVINVYLLVNRKKDK